MTGEYTIPRFDGSPAAPCRELARNGVWLVPPKDRPAGWRKMRLAPPRKSEKQEPYRPFGRRITQDMEAAKAAKKGSNGK